VHDHRAIDADLLFRNDLEISTHEYGLILRNHKRFTCDPTGERLNAVLVFADFNGNGSPLGADIDQCERSSHADDCGEQKLRT